MNLPVEFIRRLVERFEAAEVPYMVCGSVGSSIHGEPRTTQDVDLIIDPSEPAFERLLASFDESYYLDGETAREALRSRTMFNIIDLTTMWKADLIIRKADAFAQEEFRRRSEIEVMGNRLQVATPEDLILSKLRWNDLHPSERQLRDAVGVAAVYWRSLDRPYLQKWAQYLDISSVLQQVLSEAEQRQNG